MCIFVLFSIKKHLAIAVVGQKLPEQIELVLETWFKRRLLLLPASDAVDGMRLHQVRWHQVQWLHKLQGHLTLLTAPLMEPLMPHRQLWHQVELHPLEQRQWQWLHQPQVRDTHCKGNNAVQCIILQDCVFTRCFQHYCTMLHVIVCPACIIVTHMNDQRWG